MRRSQIMRNFISRVASNLVGMNSFATFPWFFSQRAVRVAAICFGLLAVTVLKAPALILSSGSNTSDITDPGTGAPWNQVVGVMDAAGTTYDASGIYLGNGYVLTANHVALYSTVELGGVTYSIDSSYTATQIGTADLKLFRITGAAATSTVHLDIDGVNGTGAVTIVGYGVGSGGATTDGTSSGYLWGDSTTRDERWGTNTVESSATVVGSTTTSCWVTTFDSSAATTEAALTLGDSGGGMFQKVGNTWYLTGIAIGVPYSNESLYGESNYFAAVSVYSSTISQLISAVPEPETYTLMLMGGVLIFIATRKRRVRQD